MSRIYGSRLKHVSLPRSSTCANPYLYAPIGNPFSAPIASRRVVTTRFFSLPYVAEEAEAITICTDDLKLLVPARLVDAECHGLLLCLPPEIAGHPSQEHLSLICSATASKMHLTCWHVKETFEILSKKRR